MHLLRGARAGRHGADDAAHDRWRQAAGDWKRRDGFKVGNTAYVTLLDRAGRVAWRHAGPADDGAWSALEKALAALR